MLSLTLTCLLVEKSLTSPPPLPPPQPQRTKHPHTFRSGNGLVSDMFFPDADPPAPQQMIPRRSRLPSRERALILELVQEASGPAAPDASSAAAAAAAAMSLSAQASGTESSAPSTPTGGNRFGGPRRSSSSRQIGSNRRERFRPGRGGGGGMGYGRSGSFRRAESFRRHSSSRSNSQRRDSGRRYGSGGLRTAGGGGGGGGRLSSSWDNGAPGEGLLGVPAPCSGDDVPSSLFHYSGGRDWGLGAIGGSAGAAAAAAAEGDTRGGGTGMIERLLQQRQHRARHSGINPYLRR